MNSPSSSVADTSNAGPELPPGEPAGGRQQNSAKFWLWRIWQAVMLPLSYPIFVLGSLMILAFVPVALLLFRDRHARTRWLRHVLHNGARIWVWLAEALQILDVAVIDQRQSTTPNDADPENSPTLVIANHPSLIDVLLITAALPNLCCVLKGDLHYNPLFTLLIRFLDYLPNSNPEHMLNEGQARLLSGEHLLIFPEGTRTEPGQPLNFRFGAAELALRSGAAVLPITIHCHSAYLSKGHPWYRLPPDKLRYQLEIGPGIPSGQALAASSPRPLRRSARRALNTRWLNHFSNRLNAP